jgi:hypothetical protein
MRDPDGVGTRHPLNSKIARRAVDCVWGRTGRGIPMESGARCNLCRLSDSSQFHTHSSPCLGVLYVPKHREIVSNHQRRWPRGAAQRSLAATGRRRQIDCAWAASCRHGAGSASPLWNEPEQPLERYTAKRCGRRCQLACARQGRLHEQRRHHDLRWN